MKESLGIAWTAGYGLVGSVIAFARDSIASSVSHMLSESAPVTSQVQTCISIASGIGGLVIIWLSIVSFRLKIERQRREMPPLQKVANETPH